MENEKKCSICGCLMKSGSLDSINGAVIGEHIYVEGHKNCCEAVDRLVVIPNRMRLANSGD